MFGIGGGFFIPNPNQLFCFNFLLRGRETTRGYWDDYRMIGMNYSAAHVIAHTDPFFCAIRHQHLESDPNDHMKRKISRTPRSIHSYQFVSTHFLMSFCPRQQKIRPIRWNRWILLRFSRCYETSCLGWKFDEFWSKRVLGPHGNLLRPGAVCTMKLAACRRIQKDEPTR